VGIVGSREASRNLVWTSTLVEQTVKRREEVMDVTIERGDTERLGPLAKKKGVDEWAVLAWRSIMCPANAPV
jgi:hypothetical protein